MIIVMKSLRWTVLTSVVVSFVISLAVVYAVFYSAIRHVYMYQIHRTMDGVSRQVFSSMYQVMKRGWKRGDLLEFVRTMETSYQDTPLRVNIYRGDLVERLFGSVPEPRRNAAVIKSIKTGRTITYQRGGDAVFVHPVRAERECLRCHVNAKEGDVLGVIETRFETGTLMETVNRRIFATGTFLLPVNLLLALLSSALIHRAVRRLKRSVEEGISQISSVENIDKIEFTAQAPYTEFSDLESAMKELARKVKEIAVDKGVLELEAKILEKFIVTSELVQDWRNYVGKLLEDVNEVVALNVIFSVFIEGEILAVEVFWLRSPDEDLRKSFENLINREVISKLPVTTFSGKEVVFRHTVARREEEWSHGEKENLKIRTKVFLLEKPQLGGIVGVGINSELAEDPYRHAVLDAIMATLINVIGSAKAISTHVQEIEFYAMRDPLTFLYNQRSFWELLNYEMERSDKFGRKLSLILIDLDNFKVVNDTYGHEFGDNVLREIAKTIADRKGTANVAARYGGDEFVVIAIGYGIREAYELAKKIKDGVEKFTFFAENDETVNIEVSIGIAAYPDHARSPRDLFLRAEKLLRRAKEEGRSKIKTPAYEDVKNVDVPLTSNRSIQVLDALNKREIVPYFQPVVDVRTGEVVANEALMRIGVERLPASKFIETAEELGVLVRMDLILYEEVFGLIRSHGYDKTIFLNFSPRFLLMEDFPDIMEGLIERYGIDPGRVVFELTEREGVKNMELLKRFIDLMIEDRGFKFAIDDFGSGYSSFYYLKNIPVHYVKIDGEFIRDMVADWRDRSFVTSIVALAKGMGIKTVAEFVEDERTLMVLREIGVDYCQGYYYGEPSPELVDDLKS